MFSVRKVLIALTLAGAAAFSTSAAAAAPVGQADQTHVSSSLSNTTSGGTGDFLAAP